MDIVKELHRLYAEYKRPEYLDLAAKVGKLDLDNLEERFQKLWEDGVSKGCDREGIPHIYPQ